MKRIASVRIVLNSFLVAVLVAQVLLLGYAYSQVIPVARAAYLQSSAVDRAQFVSTGLTYYVTLFVIFEGIAICAQLLSRKPFGAKRALITLPCCGVGSLLAVTSVPVSLYLTQTFPRVTHWDFALLLVSLVMVFGKRFLSGVKRVPIQAISRTLHHD